MTTSKPCACAETSTRSTMPSPIGRCECFFAALQSLCRGDVVRTSEKLGSVLRTRTARSRLAQRTCAWCGDPARLQRRRRLSGCGCFQIAGPHLRTSVDFRGSTCPDLLTAQEGTVQIRPLRRQPASLQQGLQFGRAHNAEPRHLLRPP